MVVVDVPHVLFFSDLLWNASCSGLGEYGSVETTLNRQRALSAFQFLCLCLSAYLSCNLWSSFFTAQVDSPCPVFLEIWWGFIHGTFELAEDRLWFGSVQPPPDHISYCFHLLMCLGPGSFINEGGKSWFGGTFWEERGSRGRGGGQSIPPLSGILFWIDLVSDR